MLDHLFIAIIIAGVPLTGMLQRRELIESLANAAPDAKHRAYSRIIVKQWSAALVLAAYWQFTGRPYDALGLRLPGVTGLVISLVVVTVVVTVLLVQVRSIQARADLAEKVIKQTENLTFMLPTTQSELRRFSWLGVTAGIVEEFICRGYVIWYLAAFMPWWVALALSSIAFGFGHLYQGMAGVIKTTGAGLFFGALYRVTGALWASMIVHAAVDVLSGRSVYFAYQHLSATGKSEAA